MASAKALRARLEHELKLNLMVSADCEPTSASRIRRSSESSTADCLRREIKEELPKLKLGRVKLWKEVKAKNRRSGRKMSDAIFVTAKASGRLTIGDKKEIDKAT